jgi:VanZ family protein
MSVLTTWTPALAWAGLIWALGGDDFSAPETSRILDPLLTWLFPDLSDATRTSWVALIRKSAHPIEYAVLALLSLHGVRRSTGATALRSFGLALLPALALASADEFRQSLSSVRTGATLDVALDLAGAAFGLLCLFGMERLIRTRIVGRGPVRHADSARSV